jgi:hypothetical protein
MRLSRPRDDLRLIHCTLTAWHYQHVGDGERAMGTVANMISENAGRLRHMHEEIHRTYAAKPHGVEHHWACKLFHEGYDTLAFPGGLKLGLERLKRLEPEAVENAIQFLEEDPWFYRSGYVKEEMVRRLKHAALTKSQQSRLRSVIMRSIRQGTRRIAHALARLAPVVDSTALVRSVESYAQSDETEISRRAQQILRVLKAQRCESN